VIPLQTKTSEQIRQELGAWNPTVLQQIILNILLCDGSGSIHTKRIGYDNDFHSYRTYNSVIGSLVKRGILYKSSTITNESNLSSKYKLTSIGKEYFGVYE
jgi:predicted transcriptional regulator